MRGRAWQSLDQTAPGGLPAHDRDARRVGLCGAALANQQVACGAEDQPLWELQTLDNQRLP
jgi:hypothetical protein